jgi:hypothetical protein
MSRAAIPLHPLALSIYNSVNQSSDGGYHTFKGTYRDLAIKIAIHYGNTDYAEPSAVEFRCKQLEAKNLLDIKVREHVDARGEVLLVLKTRIARERLVRHNPKDADLDPRSARRRR